MYIYIITVNKKIVPTCVADVSEVNQKDGVKSTEFT